MKHNGVIYGINCSMIADANRRMVQVWLDKLEKKIEVLYQKPDALHHRYERGGVCPVALLPDLRLVSRMVLVPSLVSERPSCGGLSRSCLFRYFNPVWILLSLYFYYMIGSALEREWGAFRFNVYYLVRCLHHSRRFPWRNGNLRVPQPFIDIRLCLPVSELPDDDFFFFL